MYDVGKTIINHPPVITSNHHFCTWYFFTIPSHGWCMASPGAAPRRVHPVLVKQKGPGTRS